LEKVKKGGFKDAVYGNVRRSFIRVSIGFHCWSQNLLEGGNAFGAAIAMSFTLSTDVREDELPVGPSS